MAETAHIDAGGRRLAISKPGKELFPSTGHGKLTKLDIARYYDRVAPAMLPHLKGRPLVVQRFPDGIKSEGFFQKRPSQNYPNWIKRIKIPLADGGSISMVQADSRAALVYLADQGVITFHVWLSTSEKPRRPDRVVWDLDPAPGGDFSQVRRAALWVGRFLRELGLAPFVKTTGSKGLHVVCTLRAELEFDAVREFAQKVSKILAARHSGELTVEQRKNKRGGRIFMDVMRNALGQTMVAPYSLRPLKGAPVATPLRWRELERGGLGPRDYKADNIFRRLGQMQDPWRMMRRHARSLKKPLARLESIYAKEA